MRDPDRGVGLNIQAELDYVPDDLSHLGRDLASTYFLNFSLFQSMLASFGLMSVA